MIRRTLAVLLAALVGLSTAAAPRGADSTRGVADRDPPVRLTLRGVRRPVSAQIGRVWAAEVLGDRLVVLDSKNHQVAVHEPHQDWAFFSSIGNGPGELFYPTEMALDAESGRVAVFDGGNHRVQVFDPSFQLVATSEVEEKAYGLCWWHQNRLLLGRPEMGALLSVYDPARGFVGTLGGLAAPAELSQLERGLKATFLTAINRVRVTATSQGEVWVAFIHLPLVRRYTPTRELDLESALDVEGLGALATYAQSVWDLRDRPSSAAYINIDGVQLPIVIKDITSHPGTGEPLLLLGNDWIAALSREGLLQTIAEVIGCESSFHRLAIDAKRESIVLTSLSTQSLCEVNLADMYPEVRSTAGSQGPANQPRPWSGTANPTHGTTP